jgi:hypothetical protein
MLGCENSRGWHAGEDNAAVMLRLEKTSLGVAISMSIRSVSYLISCRDGHVTFRLAA